MSAKHSVKGLDLNDSAKTGKICEHCVKGKMVSLSMKGRSEKATKPGKVIYSDVCGPISVDGNGGARYFLNFQPRSLWSQDCESASQQEWGA